MAVAVAGEVESGKLTPEEAREILEPYREVLPPLFSGEQRMVFDPDRFGWDTPEIFPPADEVQQSPQASQIFWYEADELGIKGVTLRWSEPFPLLDPVSDQDLTRLRKRMPDDRIVVKQDINEFDSMGKSVEWVRELIDSAESTANVYREILREPFGFDLVYGESEIPFGLEFLEEGYALEQRNFRRKTRMSANNRLESSAWAMMRWLDEEIIHEYGWYAPTTRGFYPVIDAENENEVVLLLESLGHTCIRDDALIQDAAWLGRSLTFS